MNIPTVVPILSSAQETDNIKTITFQMKEVVIPGQFFMIWIPGIDEIPMSVSYISKEIKGITFRRIGDATKALYLLKPGERIGFRGPYGNGFQIKGKNPLFVGGGTGIAMLAPAIESAQKKNLKSTAIIGVKSKNELFFENRLRRCGAKVFVSTDDGSKGYKGFASDLAKEILTKETFSSVYTCGPETMMKSLFEHFKKIPFQASLERFMKCSIGLCGQCCIGRGIRVCIDGPIFDGKTLQTCEDFGNFRRDTAGRKIPI